MEVVGVLGELICFEPNHNRQPRKVTIYYLYLTSFRHSKQSPRSDSDSGSGSSRSPPLRLYIPSSLASTANGLRAALQQNVACLKSSRTRMPPRLARLDTFQPRLYPCRTQRGSASLRKKFQIRKKWPEFSG